MNEACVITNVTNSKMIYSHSHKELFDWVGRKDPKRYSLTKKPKRKHKPWQQVHNHNTAVTHIAGHMEKDRPDILYCFNMFAGVIMWS